MAAEMRDLPGQDDGETDSHHSMAHGKVAGMIDLWLGLIKDH